MYNISYILLPCIKEEDVFACKSCFDCLCILCCFLIKTLPDVSTDLIFVPGEAAALHGAGVEVALVVKLEAGQARVQLVEDGRQAAPQRQQLGAGTVEADAHGALQGHASSVTQQ